MKLFFILFILELYARISMINDDERFDKVMMQIVVKSIIGIIVNLIT